MKASGKTGFSLIELMVVVAVIGILAAILIPSIARVQERGREMKCSSNLRQLQTAALSYMNANGSFPRASSSMGYGQGIPQGQGFTVNGWVASIRNGVVNGSGHAWWYERNGAEGSASVTNGTLFPFVGDAGDQEVYVCPSMARIARQEFAGDRRIVVRSYGMNPRVAGGRLYDIAGPSRTMLFADQGLENIGQGRQLLSGNDNGYSDPNPPGANDAYWDDHDLYYQRYHYRMDGSIDAGTGVANDRIEWIGEYHGPRASEIGGGRANVVFVDGHLEQVPYIHTDAIIEGNWEDGQPL